MTTAEMIPYIPVCWAVAAALGLLFRLVIFVFKFLDSKFRRG